VGIRGYFGGSSQHQSHSSFNVPMEEALQKMKDDLTKQLQEAMREEHEKIK